jgi:peptide/nickel transport system substrate-binding protein
MRRPSLPTVATLVALIAAAGAVAGCGRALPTAAELVGASSGAGAVDSLSPTTDPPTRTYTQPVVWATYRMVQTLDPIQAFDYPEDTVDTALCDSVLRQNPDGTIGAGIAVGTYPTPTKLVLNLRSGPTFWDGKPVTADDVAFSLQRAASPTAGGFYSQVFQRVKSIVATSPSAVTLTLKQPDYWLAGELSEMAGVVVEKAYAEREGKKFGTPAGLTMCSGPYEVKQWTPGQQLVAVANPHYWDSTLAPRAREIIFKGIGDDASLTAGLETGAIQGAYPTGGLSTLEKLKADRSLTVSAGPSLAVDAMVISSLKGALGDVRVRQALSLAIDRSAYISAAYHGYAQLPRTLENPGQWGYGKGVFQKDWNSLPGPTVNLTKARALIKAAGATGKSFTIGTTSQIQNLATAANLVRQAATQIGLNATIKSVSAADYINFFTDAGARKGIDMFPTSNYPDYADPAGLYKTLVLPTGTQDYDGFSDPAITAELNKAQTTADPDLRAGYVAKAGDRIAQLLPWIPLAAPDALLITHRNLTGAPASFVYMGGPWASMMGGR